LKQIRPGIHDTPNQNEYPGSLEEHRTADSLVDLKNILDYRKAMCGGPLNVQSAAKRINRTSTILGIRATVKRYRTDGRFAIQDDDLSGVLCQREGI